MPSLDEIFAEERQSQGLPAQRSELDRIMEGELEWQAQRERMASTGRMVAGTTPQDAADRRTISRKTGVSSGLLTNPKIRKDYEAMAKILDFPVDRLLGTETGKWISNDLDNAALSKDDLNNLLDIEDATKRANAFQGLSASQRDAVAHDLTRVAQENRSVGWKGELAPTANAVEHAVRGFFGRMGAGIASLPMAGWKTLGDLTWNYHEQDLTDLAHRIVGNYSTNLGMDAVSQSFVPESTEAMTQRTKVGVQRYLKDPATGQTFENPAWATIQKQWVQGTDWVRKGINEFTTRDTLNTAESLPGMMYLGAAPGAPAIFATNAAVDKQEAARKFFREKHPGQDLGAKENALAFAEGMGSGTLNALLMTKVPASVPAETQLGNLGTGLARAATLGTGMTVGENALALLHGETKKPLDGNLQSMITFLGLEAPGILGHAMGIRNEQVAMRSALKAAEKSKLLDLAPDKFREVMGQITDKEVYIPAEAMTSYFQSVGLDPSEAAEKMGAKNFVEAQAAGTDVAVPMADFLTSLAGTPHAEALMPDMKFHPADWTPRQVQEHSDELVQAQETMNQMAGVLAKDSAIPEAKAKLVENFTRQFEGIGYEPSTAATYADIFANMMHVASLRSGVDVGGRWDLSFSRSNPGEKGMSQADRILSRLQAAGVGTAGETMFQGEIPHGVHFKNLPRDVQEHVTRSIENEIDGWASDPESFHRAYDANEETHGGQLVNGDIIYSMLPTVAKDLFQGHTAGESIDIGKLSYLNTLRKAQAQRAIDRAGDKPVAITAGGQASGKTTMANWLISDGHAGAVIDAPHDRAQDIETIIQMAKNVHKDADVYFVVRPDLKASEISNIKRALREGRYVEPRWRGDTTAKVPGEILKVAENHRNDPRVGLHVLVNREGQNPDYFGGKLNGDGKDAVQAIRDLETPSSEQLAKTAAEAYDSYQKEASNGHPDFPILPDYLRSRIDAANGRGTTSEPGGAEALVGYHQSPELSSQQGLPGTEQAPELGQVAEALRSLGINPAEVKTGAELLQRLDQVAEQRPELAEVAHDLKAQLGTEYFQNDRRDRARSAMSRSLSPSHQSAELTRRAEEAKAEADAFAAWENEVKQIQIGDVHEDNRGFIQFGPDRKVHIGLLEKADLSTLIHEVQGHFGLEMMRDLAELPNAPKQIVDDFAAIRKELGVEPGAAFRAEHHEKFARMTERYFMEGKAPSEELRGTFARVKEWMKLIYRKVEALGVRLKPEVREIFDRMYASDEAIAQAREAVEDSRPLFLTAEDAGMSPAKFEVYQKLLGKASEQASAELEPRLISDAQRQHEAWWKGEAEKVREEMTTAVDARKDFQALRILHEGKLEDGTPIKLDRDQLVKLVGEDAVKGIKRSKSAVYTREGGMDVDTAAELLGFRSGKELAETLVNMPDRKELIERLTDEIMKGRHGDMMTDGTLSEAAMEAVHNQAREERLAMELKAFRTLERQAKAISNVDKQAERAAAREAMDVPPTQTFRDAARELVTGQSIKDLQPNRYLIASRQESRKAFESASKKDYAAAGDAKQKELLNHFLYLEAVKAKAEAEKDFRYMQRFEKASVRQSIAKAGGDEGQRVYLDQIDNIREMYQFVRETNKAINARQARESLATFAVAQANGGEMVSIDPMLYTDAPRNYRELNLPELRAVVDAVKNLETIARRSREFIRDGKAVEFKDAIAELVATARGNLKATPLPIDTSVQTRREKLASAAKKFDSEFIKMEEMIDRLDAGDINGPFRRYIFEPMCEAQFKEYELNERVTKGLMEAMEAMPKEQRLSLEDKFDIDGLGTVSKKYLLSMAMNMGNESNQAKMLKGMGWADRPEMVGKALSHLNREDWEFVQKTWNTLESLWPEIDALELRMTGLSPEKVQARPFAVELADGSTMHLDGGYYPVAYEPKKSTPGAKQADVDIMTSEGGWNAPITAKGHTKARIEQAAHPLMMDFEQVLVRHTSRVIKDLSHREAATAVAKLIQDQEVRTAIQETLGAEYEAQFMPWLKGTVNDTAAMNPEIGRWMLQARSNMVIAGLAFRASSVIVQATDAVRVMVGEHAVKPRYMAEALAEVSRHPFEMADFICEKSQEMRARKENLDRDTRAMFKHSQGHDGALVHAQKIGMEGLAIADAIISHTSWLAAYKQAMAEGRPEGDAIRMADRVVRLKLQSGAAKDLTALQRDGGWGTKLITTYMGDAVATYGMLSRAAFDIPNGQNVGRHAFAVLMAGMIVPILGDLIKNRGPQDDEDWLGWTAKKAMWSLPSSLPLIRDVSQAIEQGTDYKFTPLANVINKGIIRPIKMASSEKEYDWEDWFMNGMESVGSLTGLPGTSQAMTTLRYLKKVDDGKEKPDNPVGFVIDATLGPNTKKK